MRRRKPQRFNETLTVLLLALACYIFFFHGLWSIGLLGPDEPRYTAVAREMYLTGDYITPRLHGMPWFEKPILLYWLVALGFHVFGVGEFAARFPSALAATACVFFAYFVCRRLWGRTTAMWTALILATSVGTFAFARAASTDMLLTACLTLALLCFLLGYNSKTPDRLGWFLAFYSFIGFGVLAKGPVAILLPALSLGLYLLLAGRRDEWKEWHPLYALVILAIAAPWYLAVAQANGFEFAREFFINHNLERFTSTVHGHPRPFYFYIPVLIMLTFPWTFTLIPALRRAFDRTDRILLWFAALPIVFFSFAGSKLPGYILPSVAPIAMLSARSISNVSSRAFRISTFIEAGMMLFIGVAFGFFGDMLNVDPHISGLRIAAISVAIAAGLAAIAIWLRPTEFAIFNAAVMAALVLIATNFVLPRFETTDTMRPWQDVLQSAIPADRTILLFRPARWMVYGMQYYRFNKLGEVWTPEDLDAVLQDGSKAYFIADDKRLEEFGQMTGVKIKILATVGNQSLFEAWSAR
jgi:4-amino-4-deoxy-L-arabinose transferase-like glycosyltransferase